MVTTTNQFTDIFKGQIGRDPTPYEIDKYSKSSIQDLASLKDIYAKQDPNSLVGYLGSTGQDFSLPAMQRLAQEKGIYNFGTPEGNDALLKSLKGVTSSPSVGGTIAQTPNEIDANNKSKQGETTLPSGALLNPDGSVKTAADSFDNNTKSENGQPPKIEGIDSALQSYQGVQSQIRDIDTTLRKSEQDIKEEAARSGGFISASQLKGLVYDRNKPLLEQRAQLVSEQAQYGKMYTDLLARQKESDANFFKTQQIDQGQQKIDVSKDKNTATQALAEKKMSIQQQQFEDKLLQSGYKKIADYSDGTKVGEHFINLNGQSVSVDPQTGSETPIGTGSQVGSTNSSISGNAKDVTKGKVSYSDFTSTPDAPTKENINTEYPGTMGKTYGAIYEDAVSYAETGKYQKVGMSTKPSTKAYDNAVKNKAANIASSLGMTEDQLRAVYAANKTAVSKLVTAKANISAFESKAKAQIDIILNGYIDPRTGEKVSSLNTSVSRTDYPLVNGWIVAGKQLAGDTNAQLLANSLITFTNEYAKIMTSSTGSVSASTDSARKDAAGLVSKALSEGTLDATLGLMQKEMDTTIAGYNESYKETMGNFVQGPFTGGSSQSQQGGSSYQDYLKTIGK